MNLRKSSNNASKSVKIFTVYLIWISQPFDTSLDNNVMRFESITLQNFQAHTKLTVEFGKGITTIVGATDQGKSAVLRALRWVCLNDLSGTDFVKEGERQAKVTLTVVDESGRQTTVRRTKSKDGSLNTYHLNGEEFKSFGTGVPTEIRKVLQLDEINFQSQHDSPFWFNDTAGEVSRKLNSVIDLTIIDTTLSKVGGQVREKQERLKITKERLEKTVSELKTLEPDKSRIDDFKTLNQHRKELAAKEETLHQLETVVEGISANQVEKLTCRAQEGDHLLALARSVATVQVTVTGLTDLLESINQVDLVTPPPSFAPLTQLWDEVSQKEKEREALEDLLSRIEETDRINNRQIGSVKTAQNRLAQATKGKECPLCHRPFQSQ